MSTLLLTHHKTGTTFCRRVLEALAEQKITDFTSFNSDNKITPESDLRPSILFHTHPTPYEVDLVKNKLKGVKICHFVREPRSLIVSAFQYHLKGREAWLHEPREELNGVTYTNYLMDLDFEEGIIFEMHNESYWNIKNMIDIATQFETDQIKLEDISHDKTLNSAWKFIECLDLEGTAKLDALAVAVRNSLWFGDNKNLGHVTIGVPKTRPEIWNARLEQAFTALYQDNLSALNYG